MTTSILAENVSWLLNSNGVYATIHDAAVAEYFEDSTTFSFCGQERIDHAGPPPTTRYFVQRAGFFFDMSSITPLTTIPSVIFRFYCVQNLKTGIEFDVVLIDGVDLNYPNMVAADYGDLLAKTTSLGSMIWNDTMADGWYDINLNAAGIALVQAAVDAGNSVKFGLRTSEDINSTPPGSNEYRVLEFYGLTANYYPKLVLPIGGVPAFGNLAAKCMLLD